MNQLTQRSRWEQARLACWGDGQRGQCGPGMVTGAVRERQEITARLALLPTEAEANHMGYCISGNRSGFYFRHTGQLWRISTREVIRSDYC